MDDLELWEKNEREVNFLINAVHVFPQDTGTKFGTKNCKALLI